MSQWKNVMITRLVLEQLTEDKDNPWTLGSPTTISKTENWSVSIVTSMVIWQRNANQRRKNKKHELVSNVTRKNTLPRIVKRNKWWRNKRFKKNWIVKKTRKKRVLTMISSRHSIRNPQYKFLEKIYYSKSPNQWGKKGIECTLKVKALVDSRYTHIRIDKQLVKDKKI